MSTLSRIHPARPSPCATQRSLTWTPSWRRIPAVVTHVTVQRLVVLLQGQPIGDITRSRDARLRFTYLYLDEWRFRPDATPLSTSMPTGGHVARPRGGRRLPVGLLPDNTDVLAAWGRRFQVSHRNAFSLLSTPVGEDCAGRCNS